jgi:hypothetical protein
MVFERLGQGVEPQSFTHGVVILGALGGIELGEVAGADDHLFPDLRGWYVRESSPRM